MTADEVMGVRLPKDTKARMNALTDVMKERNGGVSVSRSDVFRTALTIGIEELERRNGIGHPDAR